MNHIDDMLHRADIYQICSFLLYGAETLTKPSDYKEWREHAQEAMERQLRKEFPDTEKYEAITRLIYSYANAVEETYMQVGLKAGTKLILDLLRRNQEEPFI